MGRKALHFARGSDRARRSRGESDMQAPCNALSRTLVTTVATMRLHQGAKVSSLLPAASLSGLRAPRRQRSRRCADLRCTKSPLAELWLGCRTPRVHSSSESWGRGSPTNSKFRPVYAQDVRLRVGGVRGTFTQSGSDRPDRVESLGGERLSLARPRPQVERATASH